MSLGFPEIAIIVVIIIVLFGLVKMFGDKRYSKRSGSSSASKDAGSDNKA